MVLGIKSFSQGWRWLRSHPRYLISLFVPMVGGIFCMIASFTYFVRHSDVIIARLLYPRPEAAAWYQMVFYYGLASLVYVAILVFVFVAAMLVVNILAAPVYEIVSVAVEKDLTGSGGPAIGFWGNVKVALVELKKAVFILFVSLILLFIPGLNVISVLLSAFLIGWNFFDYPLARRGWSFRERLRFVRREFWSVLGLGLWLVIPVVQIVMMPLAVAGGTMLGLDALQRRSLPDSRLKS
jgi:CysZ protein